MTSRYFSNANGGNLYGAGDGVMPMVASAGIFSLIHRPPSTRVLWSLASRRNPSRYAHEHDPIQITDTRATPKRNGPLGIAPNPAVAATANNGKRANINRAIFGLAASKPS